MSFTLNWLAVETSDKAALLARLGLREVGAAVDEWSTDCAYAVTPSGWVIIASEGMRLDLDRLSPAASKEGLALGCLASEIVMVSCAEAWRDGARIWRVGHDPEQGVESLQISGAPPPELAEVADRLAAEQAAAEARVDCMFDAPLELAHLITGYRPGGDLSPWIMLAPARHGRSGRTLSALPGAIQSEILPLLPALGWGATPIKLPANGRDYVATRVRNGRLEALRFLWLDDDKSLEIIPNLAILEGDSPDGEVIFSGSYRAPSPAEPLWRRLKARFSGARQPAPSYEDRVEAVVAHIRQQLPDLDPGV